MQVSNLFCKWFENESQLIKHHGTVDNCSSEQQFCKSDVITFAVEKFWGHTPSILQQAGRQNTGKFKIRHRYT